VNNPPFANNQANLAKCKSVVELYFAMLNLGLFTETAKLFAPDGVLYPPVEEPVAGRSAIAHYLHNQLDGMQLEPLHHQLQILCNGLTQIQVVGKAKLCPFGIDVLWIFWLNAQAEIEQLWVNLISDTRMR
jgi:hypothetical protein